MEYCRLNAETVRNSYLLVRIDDCIDYLGDARIFSSLHAISRYWQIEIDQHGGSKTALASHRGLFQVVRMPIGLKNAPVTFQRGMDVTLS